MTLALALPDPQAVAIGRARDVLAEVAVWAQTANDAGEVIAALRWTLAVEKLLAPRSAEGPARTAARLLEARIGDLDEPEAGGRGNRHAHGTLSRTRRYEFRMMAEYRDLWAHRLPLSRSQVLSMIRQVQRAMGAKPVSSSGMDLRHGDFRVALGDLSGSVDLVVTDPPYSPTFLPLWEDLSSWASTALKPDGLLLAMGAPMLMPEFLAALSTSLEYRWTIAWLMLEGVETRQYQRKAGSRWKPVFVFKKPGAATRDWMADTVQGGRREKGLHDWQQSESGFVELLKAVRAQPGMLVCDPFVGSGTTAAAARSMGMDFVGAELDPATFASARMRLGLQPGSDSHGARDVLIAPTASYSYP